MDPAFIIPLAVGLLGPTGLIWVALKFNREDAKSAIGTMREISEELRLELERAQKENKALRTESAAYRAEGEALRAEVVALRDECGNLRHEVTLLRQSNEGRP